MEVEFYKTVEGLKPAGQFINLIEDVKLRAKMIRTVRLLEEFGYELGMPDSRYLEDGFVKKTKKTPRETLEKAKEYRTDYERRFRK
ncbi:MAG: type II toxin-antitoxin system RelE/ParE family toxin [Butyrivibrio sp.]|nr:type II toxin-antitoxin system RelE/ParE family toxin [Butyrivibrio sp.]MBE5859566.1 type II toxin-antitoxin system RelE/ParE family toxin [Butyrivibrio sp.]